MVFHAVLQSARLVVMPSIVKIIDRNVTKRFNPYLLRAKIRIGILMNLRIFCPQFMDRGSVLMTLMLLPR